jgi:hypothetical protein
VIKSSLLDRNWATSLKPRRRSRPQSPRFSLTFALKSREREVESPCFYYVWWALVLTRMISYWMVYSQIYFSDHLYSWFGEPCTYNNHGLSFVYNRKIIRCEEKFVDTKGVIRGRNSQMANRNMIKQQTMVNKLLHRKHRAHQTRRSGWLLRLGFNEVAQFLSRSEDLITLSVFSREWVSDWYLTSNEQLFQLYHGENKLHWMKWWWYPLYSRPTRSTTSMV